VQPSPARPRLIDRHDLVAALDHAAEKKVTVISAPAGSGKTSLLRVWAGRAGQDRRIAFMSVRPDQHDAQLFWLTLLGAVRDASGAGRGAEPPLTTPGFNGPAMVDNVLSESARPVIRSSWSSTTCTSWTPPRPPSSSRRC